MLAEVSPAVWLKIVAVQALFATQDNAESAAQSAMLPPKVATADDDDICYLTS
jgi:hypothetical protein